MILETPTLYFQSKQQIATVPAPPEWRRLRIYSLYNETTHKLSLSTCTQETQPMSQVTEQPFGVHVPGLC